MGVGSCRFIDSWYGVGSCEKILIVVGGRFLFEDNIKLIEVCLYLKLFVFLGFFMIMVIFLICWNFDVWLVLMLLSCLNWF